MARTVVHPVNAPGAGPSLSGTAEMSARRPALHVGPVLLDPAVVDGVLEGQHLGLSAGEFALLRLLASRRNVVMSKETLAAELDLANVRLVDVFVWRLRTKLAQFGLVGLVATVWGRGYAVLDETGPEDELPEAIRPSLVTMPAEL